VFKIVLSFILSEGASGFGEVLQGGSCILYLQRFISLLLVQTYPWKTMFTHPLFWHWEFDQSTKRIAAGRRGGCNCKLVLNVRRQEAVWQELLWSVLEEKLRKEFAQ